MEGFIGVIGAGVVVFSKPIGAKGFGLPSLPVGFNKILESRKFIKAGLEKIESSNFIFFTLNNTDKRSLVIEEFCPEVFVLDTRDESVFVEETKLFESEEFLIKNIYTNIKAAITIVKIIIFFIFEAILIL